MKVVVGLGNPGRRYEQTRHNLGFWVIVRLAEQLKPARAREQWNGLIAETQRFGEPILLVQPLTYMNKSGDCIQQILKNSPQLDAASDLIVIYDDLDLPPGMIRLRKRGSAGGHNGMKSIISAVGNDNIQRIRLGIGHPDKQPVIDYVLDRPDSEEMTQLEDAVNLAAEASLLALESGFDAAMNKYN